MREMRKILCFVFAVFFATSAMAAKSQKKASFSIHCYGNGVDCEIQGDQSSITKIDNCNSPQSWKPAPGTAYLINVPAVSNCLEKSQIKCDRKIIFILNDTITKQSDNWLILCEDETSYEQRSDTNSEFSWYVYNLGTPYNKRLCTATGGVFNEQTGSCQCHSSSTGFTKDGCMCKYGETVYLDSADVHFGCGGGGVGLSCTRTGGHRVNNASGTRTCECPTELNLVPTSSKDACICKDNFTWQNPENMQNGCVEKGKTLNISVTVKSNEGQKLSGVKITYYDDKGKKHETTTNSDGVFNIPNMQNTSYATIALTNYVPTTLSAKALAADSELILQYIPDDKMGEYYNLCTLQAENPARAASGIRAKTDYVTENNWLYCGVQNANDCGYYDTVISVENYVYICKINPQTREGIWELLDADKAIADGTMKRCTGTAGFYNDIFCGNYGKFEHILYNDKIIALRGLDGEFNYRMAPDGSFIHGYHRDDLCYENVSDCSTGNIHCGTKVCSKLDTGPKWGVPDEVTQVPSATDGGDDDVDADAETPTTCEDSGGTLGEDGTTCTCDSASGLKANADNTLCECLDSNMTFNNETKKCTVSTENLANSIASQDLGALANTNKNQNKQQNKDERLAQAEANLKLAKDTEQSFANRMLGGATTAATGLGMMTAASARAEQKADADAEQDMTAYLATFKCEYGRGLTAKAGNEEITLPGGNELLEYYSEYKSLADNLKNTKKALGLRPGIEQEIVYDKAQSNLYKYSSTGITQGAFTSLSRALTDTEGADAEKWNAQKEKTATNLKTGLIAAGTGIVGGIAGNYLINKDVKYQELKQEIHEAVSEVQEEHPAVIAPTPKPEEPKPEPEKPQPAETKDVPKPIQTAIEVTPIPMSSIVTPTKFELEEFSVTSAGFDSGKTTLNAEGVTALNSLVRKILGKLVMDDRFQDRVINIKVIGHTDSTGISAATQKREGYKTNPELSEKRAASVVAHLQKGLTTLGERVTYADPVGQGDTWCIENNKPKNSAECRRVDVAIEDITPAAQ